MTDAKPAQDFLQQCRRLVDVVAGQQDLLETAADW